MTMMKAFDGEGERRRGKNGGSEGAGLPYKGNAETERRGSNEGLYGPVPLYATMASLAIACPLLAIMSLSLFASFTLLLLASPLLIIFSPLIVPAAVVLGGAVTAFALAALMAIAGISAFSWIFRCATKKPTLQMGVRGIGGGPNMVTEAGFEVKGPDTTLSADGQVQKEVQVGAAS